MRRLRAIVVVLCLLSLALLGPVPAATASGVIAGGVSPGAAAAQDVGPGHALHQGPNGEADVQVCTHAVGHGVAHCDAHVRIDAPAKAARPAKRSVPIAGIVGNNGAYDPSYLQSAYNLASLAASAGAGVTIAIVDAYDDPTAASDLASYRAYFGLPTAPSFHKVNQNGVAGSYPMANSGWDQEISLDLDMVSATCPNCNILLVEANTASFSDLAAAVNTAAGMGAMAISNSYGGGEFGGETSYDSAYNHPGAAVIASAGDGGYGTEYPAAASSVTAVGGTTLNQLGNAGTRTPGGATETVWSGSGSGCSGYEPKPTWQHDTGCGMRTVADVAAVADPNTGVWVEYNGGWYIFGGTSVASPIIAAVYALAGQPAAGTYPSRYPYAQASALNDVTTGGNGTCSPAYLCTGEAGYDGPTGEGTPNGDTAFVARPTASFSVGASALSPATLAPGSSGAATVAVTGVNGYGGTVGLTTSVAAPAGAATPVTAALGASSLTPSSANPSPSTTLTVTAPTGAAAGGYTVTVTGSDGVNSSGAAVTLTVVVPDFTLAATTSAVQVTPGKTANDGLNVSPSNGFTGAVTFSAAGLPTGATAAFSPSLLTFSSSASSQSATLSIATAASGGNATPPGSYPLTITATGSGVSHMVSVTLTVGDFALSLASGSIALRRGSTSAPDTVTLTSLDGYSAAGTLSLSGLPSQTSASFSANPITPTASSALTIHAAKDSTRGTYQLTLTATGADGTTHTVPVALTIS